MHSPLMLLDDLPPLGLRESDGANSVRNIIGAIDLDAWLTSLNADDQLLLSLVQTGYSLGEIAGATRHSTSFVFDRLGALGQELAWRAEVALDPPAAREGAPWPSMTPRDAWAKGSISG